MKKNLSKIFFMFICTILAISMTGCSWFGNKDETSKNLTDNVGILLSVEDLKNEFEEVGSVKYFFKPFYNVEQTTEFTFHFNSVVDPVKAITVHTDSKCEESSTVYQINDGYITEKGEDVVVKPLTPVLKTDARTDSQKSGIWGYAPIYYLCIRYDLDSTSVKKLDEPIVVPFTIKNDISTPNAYTNISDEGIISVKWLPVNGASSYKIYRSLPFGYKPEAKNKTREECAYIGDVLKLVDTVDSSTTEYIAKGDSIFSDTSIKDNSYVDSSGYVQHQNDEFRIYLLYNCC